eukprot:TRINITY_DN2265_c0_g1_i1.p1 TRINITY_DN2265_c0_g1~~TRINITY_DN2265_c0_g1_i1.p1  ORF type:complete len:312 (-),score=-47.54 TRINITY_DN2265_c0_g1_i1:73-1008(-)
MQRMARKRAKEKKGIATEREFLILFFYTRSVDGSHFPQLAINIIFTTKIIHNQSNYYLIYSKITFVFPVYMFDYTIGNSISQIFFTYLVLESIRQYLINSVQFQYQNLQYQLTYQIWMPQAMLFNKGSIKSFLLYTPFFLVLALFRVLLYPQPVFLKAFYGYTGNIIRTYQRFLGRVLGGAYPWEAVVLRWAKEASKVSSHKFLFYVVIGQKNLLKKKVTKCQMSPKSHKSQNMVMGGQGGYKRVTRQQFQLKAILKIFLLFQYQILKQTSQLYLMYNTLLYSQICLQNIAVIYYVLLPPVHQLDAQLYST